MATEQNNTLINTFIKGMNSDTSYQMLDELSYALAKNLRLFSLDGDNKHGELKTIEGVLKIKEQSESNISTVLAATSIRDYAVVVIKYEDETWAVFRFKDEGEDTELTKIFTSDITTSKDRFDLVGRYEDDTNIKLYIATGETPILCLNIAPCKDSYNQARTVAQISSYPEITFNPPTFNGYVSGKIKPGLVQYSYRLYNKNTVSTDVSPTTPLIPIIDDFEKKGYTESETTNCGVFIQIELGEVAQYDKILIYRIHYAQNGQLPTVELIGNKSISGSNTIVRFTDVGQNALQTITLDEYNSFSGIHVLPNTIESKNDYLFAGAINNVGDLDSLDYVKNYETRTFRFNSDKKAKISNVSAIYSEYITLLPANSTSNPETKQYAINYSGLSQVLDNCDCYLDSDDINNTTGTTYKYQSNGTTEGGEGPNIKWKFVLDKTGTDKYKGDTGKFNYGLERQSYDSDYNFRSLRRGELYRYGIVLYDKYGQSSSAKWIADIRTPSYNENKPYEMFQNGSNIGVYSNVLGIEFTVNNLPDEIVAYEIVRCNRTSSDMRTLSQGVVSRPIKRYELGGKAEYEITDDYPFTPTGYLTTIDWLTGKLNYSWITAATKATWDKTILRWEATNYGNNSETVNKNTYQFVSAESTYNKNNLYLLLKNNQIELETLSYLYPSNILNKYIGTTTSTSNYIPNSILNFDSNGRVYQPSGQQTLETWYLADRSRTGTSLWSNTLGYFSYVDISGNKQGGVNLINWYGITSNIFSYIKLYQNLNLGTSLKYEIDDVNIAQESGWNDFSECKVGSDGDSSYPSKYLDNNIVIGNSTYCNFVIGGAYAIPIGGNELGGDYIRVDNDVEKFNGDASEVVYGTGGRCLTIHLKNVLDTGLVNGYGTTSTNGKTYSTLSGIERVGTYLCNLVQKVTPYGGYDKYAKEICTYYSYGNYAKKSTSNVIKVFDGDCYVMPLEYTSMHKVYLSFQKDSLPTSQIMYSIPLESSINLLATSGHEFSRNTKSTNIQIEPSTVFNKYTQSKPLYEYNTAYSSNDKTKLFPAYNYEENDCKNTDYRVYHSNLKDNNELLDSWLKFQTNDYLDVDTRYGAITNLTTFKNNLYFWQEDAFGVLSVNERTVMNDQNNMPLILGQGGVLTRYDYINTKAGMHKGHFSVTQSPDLLYFYDGDNNIIHAVQATSDSELSVVKNVQNIMKDYRSDDNVPIMMFDNQYNELISKVLDEQSIVYNEKAQVFTSLYDMDFDDSVTMDDKIYLIKADDDNIKLYKWNTLTESTPVDTNDNPLSIKLKYVVNKSPISTKVFDNLEIITSTPKHALFGAYRYTWDTDLDMVQVNNVTLTDREGNFRFAVPRYGNSRYGNRLRGKYMVCTIEGQPFDNETSITYILTKFRGSLS